MSDRLSSPYQPQGPVLQTCLSMLQGQLDWSRVMAQARPWVQAVRSQSAPFWALERLLNEYPMTSAEGLALMHLAEALLRVPDTQTALLFAADQLQHASFHSAHDSVAAHIMASALLCAKKGLPDPQAAPHSLNWLQRASAGTVLACMTRAVQLLGQQFVLGQDLPQALSRAQASSRWSFDMLGEGARTQAQVLHYERAYSDAIAQVAKKMASAQTQAQPCHAKDGVSIKLSALHPRYEFSQRERVMQELVPRVWVLCEQAARADIPLTLDAEEAERLELSLDVFDALAQRAATHHPQWEGLGLAVQAYQTRALEVIAHIHTLAQGYGLRVMCRLVKGAYWDGEVKRAQEAGLADYPVFTHKHHTDLSYLACAHALLQAAPHIYAQFATHNAATIAAVLQLAQQHGVAFELQRLHGMGEAVYAQVLATHDVPVRVYAPVGPHKDLLAYLVRRLLENGANASFVHRLADTHYEIDALLASPLWLNPAPGLVSPHALYGAQRPNSPGCDFAVAAMRQAVIHADVPEHMPVHLCTAAEVAQYVMHSRQAYPQWRAQTVQARAALLRKAAHALSEQAARFCSLLVQEARKTWIDAYAEVREAIDYLYYYAAEAERVMQPLSLPVGAVGLTGERNTLCLVPRGVWVCISPWNFPLAIFIGQVAAALATGNTVLAKPAMQTPRIAQAMVDVLHHAGVPEHAVQLVHGAGSSVGQALVVQPGIAGVAFTGSTAVAKKLERSLAQKDGPIVPLIAETGGVNAMLVDSTALPEQVIDAVMQSTFRSSGQRCSALRLLCVHEALAPTLLPMLYGAIQELHCGPAHDLATDVGPVIDHAAYVELERQIAQWQVQGKCVTRVTTVQVEPDLVLPTVVELSSVSELTQEIFGPVLHVVRWQGDPAELLTQIHALGYGLTLGLQTRINSRAVSLAAQAQVGNVYINRSMIGAVVGVQPFGGQGLSGTGPKAGGPHYLPRFCTEQTVTINTAAAGGNAELLG